MGNVSLETTHKRSNPINTVHAVIKIGILVNGCSKLAIWIVL